MDTRYRDQGYSAKLTEAEHGAYLTIRRGDKVVAEVAIGFFHGGANAKAQVIVKRFAPDELREVAQIDDFETD